MNFAEYSQYDATGLAELVHNGEVSAQELATIALTGIEKLNPTLNAVVEKFEIDQALEQTKERSVKPAAPFSGVPMLFKDTPVAKGIKAEYGSRFLEGYSPAENSHIWEQLTAGGFTNIGRTTTSEMGIAAVTENQVTGITRNPWNPALGTSGSSGGSASVVAAGIVPVAHGGDGGGSIRNPASFCGLVGLKPTRGRVSGAPGSVSGYNGLSGSFVFTRTVRDCARILDLVSGPVAGDYFELPKPDYNYYDLLDNPVKKLRIALTCKSWSGFNTEKELIHATNQSALLCQELGHNVEEASPEFNYEEFIAAQKVIWAVHIKNGIDAMAKTLNRQPSLDNLQTGTIALYEKGKHIDATEFTHSLAVYERITREMGNFFKGYDVLITPTSPFQPEPVNEYDPNQAGLDINSAFRQLEAKESYTSIFNGTGNPAISLPLQQSSEGIPLGTQFTAGYGNDNVLCQLANQLEQQSPWLSRRPKIHISNS